ncbi:MAG: SRPBCC family protein [Myxococcales bacterium]|nr:SRPBCC family protein [Myxococcales bacterium]
MPAMPSFEHTRSIPIAAPPAAVHALVADLHAWTQWSPWEGLDADLKRTYSGSGKGVGARYAWVGKKSGEGSRAAEMRSGSPTTSCARRSSPTWRPRRAGPCTAGWPSRSRRCTRGRSSRRRARSSPITSGKPASARRPPITASGPGIAPLACAPTARRAPTTPPRWTPSRQWGHPPARAVRRSTCSSSRGTRPSSRRPPSRTSSAPRRRVRCSTRRSARPEPHAKTTRGSRG